MVAPIMSISNFMEKTNINNTYNEMVNSFKNDVFHNLADEKAVVLFNKNLEIIYKIRVTSLSLSYIIRVAT